MCSACSSYAHTRSVVRLPPVAFLPHVVYFSRTHLTSQASRHSSLPSDLAPLKRGFAQWLPACPLLPWTAGLLLTHQHRTSAAQAAFTATHAALAAMTDGVAAGGGATAVSERAAQSDMEAALSRAGVLQVMQAMLGRARLSMPGHVQEVVDGWAADLGLGRAAHASTSVRCVSCVFH